MRTGLHFLIQVVFVAGAAPTAAQRPVPHPRAATPSGAAQLGPRVKGIWEPVGFPEDLDLRDVYFVTPEEGWAAGAAGTILHTTDAGATWTPQLGGDPHSTEKSIADLRFIDRVHGWAVQDNGFQSAQRLLRTTDGQTWEQIGVLDHSSQYNYSDYRFTSPNNGVFLVGEFIYQTHDAGRHWSKVFDCKTKTEIEGLTKEVDCSFNALYFPTTQIGYAVGANRDIEDRFFLAKTEDGGATWTVTLPAGPDMVDSFGSRDEKLFFTDPNSGIMTVENGRKIYATQDGGRTWRGVIGVGLNRLAFADPEVGWSLERSTLSYTSDGGAHWLSRELRFPATVSGFSLPRRDRAYVVGEHGMVFRYRVVPMEFVAAKALDAPTMPVFLTPLDDRVADLERQVGTIDSSFQASFTADASDATAPTGGAVPAGGPPPNGVPPTAPGEGSAATSPFISKCCVKRLSAFELVLRAVGGIVPDFLAKYKNLNLLVQGLRTAAVLPEMSDSVRTAFQAFRTAADRPAATTALAGLKSVLASLKAAVDTALQKKGTP